MFREEILHKLPVEKLFQHYDEFNGRKTKELYAMLGLVIIQQMQDYTDQDAVDNFALNLMWQYALNITRQTIAHLTETWKEGLIAAFGRLLAIGCVPVSPCNSAIAITT